jgi:hypothetical protein
MNIHREMAIYTILANRAKEAFHQFREAQDKDRENGRTEESSETVAEYGIYFAINQLLRDKKEEICNAFEELEAKVKS